MNAVRDVAVVAGREIVERGRSVYYLGSLALTLLPRVGEPLHFLMQTKQFDTLRDRLEKTADTPAPA